MDYRLPPLSTVNRHADGSVTVATPDARVTVRGEAAEALLSVTRVGSVADAPALATLIRAGVLVGAVESPTTTHTDRVAALLRERLTELTAMRVGRNMAQGAAYQVEGVSDTGRRLHGHAWDRDPQLALLKAAVELYERLACDGLHNPSSAQPSGPIITSGSLMRHDWQVECAPEPAGGQGPWLPATRAHDGASAAASFETCCYPHRLGPRVPTGSNSSGVAAHPAGDRASMASLLEVIERDAVLIWWFTCWSPPRLKDSRWSGFAGEVLNRYDGADVTILDLTIDTFPVVLAGLLPACENEHSGSGQHVGPMIAAAAGANIEEAADRALRELDVGYMYERARAAQAGAHHVEGQEENRSERPGRFGPREHRARQALRGGTLDRRLRIGAGAEHGSVTPTELPKPLSASALDDKQETALLLRDRGLDWFLVELDPDGSRRAGVAVRRSIVPGFMPMPLGGAREPLAHPRLRRAARMLGAGLSTRSTPHGYEPHPLG